MAKIDQPAADIQSQLSRSVSRNVVMATVLEELVQVLDQFGTSGFSVFRDEWLDAHTLHEKEIRVRRENESDFYAFVRDVGSDGSLIVDRAGQRMLLVGGEISVREVRRDQNENPPSPGIDDHGVNV